MADVLDAWFDPSPSVVAAFRDSENLIRTSPDPDCIPLIQAVCAAKSIPYESISVGAGSSEIIHRVLPMLARGGPAVILDPTYSEYAYVLNRAGCPVFRHALSVEDGFHVSIESFCAVAQGASLVVLVNPNNPTGQVLTAAQVMELRARLDPDTLLWVDEAYIDYAPDECTVEAYAATQPNLFVLKSLSKAYALSGLRVAYLVGQTAVLSPPPWIVSNPAMVAAIAALCDPDYYETQWRETNRMTQDFAQRVGALDLVVHSGCLNAILVESPRPNWADELAQNGLIVRTPVGMGHVLGDRYVRIGLKVRDEWSAMIDRLRAGQ